jgi:hypothetical protein
MYSPININNDQRIVIKKKEHIVYGTRKIKKIKEIKIKL